MKITIEQYEHTITYSVKHNDVSMEEMLEILERMLQATGYVFSGNLEIVSEWSDNEETFKQQEQ